MISKRTLQLTFRGQRPTERFGTRWFRPVLEETKAGGGESWQEINKKRLWQGKKKKLETSTIASIKRKRCQEKKFYEKDPNSTRSVLQFESQPNSLQSISTRDAKNYIHYSHTSDEPVHFNTGTMHVSTKTQSSKPSTCCIAFESWHLSLK